jgi:hypothetical protein
MFFPRGGARHRSRRFLLRPCWLSRRRSSSDAYSSAVPYLAKSNGDSIPMDTKRPPVPNVRWSKSLPEGKWVELARLDEKLATTKAFACGEPQELRKGSTADNPRCRSLRRTCCHWATVAHVCALPPSVLVLPPASSSIAQPPPVLAMPPASRCRTSNITKQMRSLARHVVRFPLLGHLGHLCVAIMAGVPRTTT